MANRLALPALLTSLALLYIGERVLLGTPRSVVSGIAGVLLASAFGLALQRFLAAKGNQRRAALWTFLAYKLVGDSVLVYLVQSDWLAWVTEGVIYDVLRVTWPALMLLGAAPAVAMEVSLRTMRGAPEIELARVGRAAKGALIIALTLITFASLNVIGSTWNRKVDLSYFKTTAASESTKALVQTLNEDVEVFLFYPPGNEVLDRLSDYLSELEPLNSRLRVEVVDQALEPDLARELRVRGNGFVVVRHGKNSETLRVDLDLADARRVLRRLDGEIQERLLRVTRPDRVAYFTTGHLERGWSTRIDDPRLPLSELKGLLEGMGFEVKTLGLADGLGERVPDDATLVVVAGPTEHLIESERSSLVDYLKRGGGLLYAGEPDHGSPDIEMLSALGMRMSSGLVASDRAQVRVPGKPMSPYNLATNGTQIHPIVNSFSATSRRLAFVVLGAGDLSLTDAQPKGVTAHLVVKSGADAYVDENGDRVRQDGEETGAKTFVAAVDIEAGDQEGKAVVFSDADALANGVLNNPGNAFLVVDAVRWLAGDTDIAKGAPVNEEDVKIVYRKDEDKYWFYGTTLASPVLVLALGLLYTRRRRRFHS